LFMDYGMPYEAGKKFPFWIAGNSP